jgi:hypothetical protein
MYDIEQMNRHLQSWMGNGATARAIPLELKCSFGGRAPKSRPLGRSMCDSSEGGAKPFASSSSAAVHWSTHARRQVARAGGAVQGGGRSWSGVGLTQSLVDSTDPSEELPESLFRERPRGGDTLVARWRARSSACLLDSVHSFRVYSCRDRE